jgi:hypothetical protein
LALVLVVASTVMLTSPAFSANLLTQALKLFGIGYVVSHFGPQIDKFITSLAGQRGVQWEGATKVVPIVSVGQGLFVGAAQIIGEPTQVDKVKAVGQLETTVSNFSGKLLVPVDTTSPTKNLARVNGVGVSALIDFKI